MNCFHFSHHRKPNDPSSSQVRKTNVNKTNNVHFYQKCSLLILLIQKRFFSAVSAAGSEVIAASLDRHFADLSAASLDSAL